MKQSYYPTFGSNLQKFGVLLLLGVCLALLFGVPNAVADLSALSTATPTPGSHNASPLVATGDPRDAVQSVSMNGIRVLKIDLRNSNIRVRTWIANNNTGGYQTVQAMAQAAGAIAAINADYFGSGKNSYNAADGLTYADGTDYTRGGADVYDHRSALGLSQDMRPKIGIGRGALGGYLYNVASGGPQFMRDGSFVWGGVHVRGNCTTPGVWGDVEINGELFGCSARDWDNAKELAAVGFSGDGNTLYLAVSDSGQSQTMHQMHDVLWQQGARHALRLDGGGSRTLYYNGYGGSWTIGGGRAVANALVVIPNSTPPASCNPGSEGVVLYSETNYGGRCSTFTGDDSRVSDNTIGNDAAQSLRVLGNYEATLYEHDDYGGASWGPFRNDQADLGSAKRQASSLRVSRVVQKSDLVPLQASDWPYPIVPASNRDTHTANTLYAGQPVYMDWGVKNQGSANLSGSFYVDVYLDSTRFIHYPFNGLSSGSAYEFNDWAETFNSPGWHTLKIVVDPTGAVDESAEGNNTWERQFYWEPTSFAISGYVRTASGSGISGVTVSIAGQGAVTTDNNGYYSKTGVPAGSCTVTPSKSGYTFDPTSRNVAVGPDATAANFVGTPTQSNGKKIGLEAGHGNGYSGALSCDGTIREADITLQIANRAANILRGQGFQVDIFRYGDAGMRGYRADAFVALHTDYCAGSNSGYKVSRYGGAAGTGLNGSGDASDRLAQSLWDEYGQATGLPRDTEPGHFTSCMRWYYALNSVNGGRACDGTTVAYIDASTPGAIIEMGWLSGDLNALVNRQDALATGVANSIIRFLNGDPGGPDPDDGRTLVYGQSVNGTINPATDRDTYYFAGSAGQRVAVTMNKASGNSLDSFVELYKPDGSLLGTDDDSGGNLNSRLTRDLPQNGTYRIIARSWSSSSAGGYTLGLGQEMTGDADDGRWLSFGQSLNGTISPNDDRDTYYFNGTAGRVVSIRMDKAGGATLDSYLELWSPSGTKIAENDDGGGTDTRNSWLVFALPQGGAYRIIARSWNLASSGGYTIRLNAVTSSNLARGKGVVASSVEFNGVEPEKVVDGSLATRWSSRFTDPGWIYVDLGADYTINQVVLKWETACARRYGIYVWRTGDTAWRNVNWTDSGDGGTDTINFNSTAARWVMMYGVQRGTPWGYSLWEFEVYNTANTLIPTVPPEPGDKGSENVTPLTPLPPTDPGKEVDLVGDGADGQEDIPTPAEPAESPELDTTVTYYPPIAAIEAVSPLTVTRRQGMVAFYGSASDNDEGGASIVTYRWYSSLDGALSDQPTFAISATALTTGTHVITFEAQDNEGAWSAPVTTTLVVTDVMIYQPPTATIDSISPLTVTLGQGSVTFTGSATDSDEDGASIVAYWWSSSLDGALSEQAVFTRPASTLSPGTHVILFEAQDNEGVWSTPVTATIAVLPRYTVYLPTIVR